MNFGTMQFDGDLRIDFENMRKFREGRIEKALAASDVDALLLFDANNIRYATSTSIGEWSRDKLLRYTLIPRGARPIHFEFGSALPVKKVLSPWLKDRMYPSIGWMRGAVPREAGFQEAFTKQLTGILKEQGISGGKIGIDIMDATLLDIFQAQGLKIVDGQDIMLEARRIKCKDEIHCLEGAASMVDAAYGVVVRHLRAGIRENELVAKVNECLYTLGSDQVESMNCISGPRTSPHPHNFSDRLIRPNEGVFIDIMHSWNGYRTCYYRTFHVGKASQAMHDAYKKTYEWLQASIEQVKPGNTTADVARVWPTAESLGFPSEIAAFGLQIGHGIGVSIHEKPVISRAFSLETPSPLEEGMVFALETYCAAADGSGAGRIEEECVVTKDGCRVITKFPCEELICVDP